MLDLRRLEALALRFEALLRLRHLPVERSLTWSGLQGLRERDLRVLDLRERDLRMLDLCPLEAALIVLILLILPSLSLRQVFKSFKDSQ